MGNPLSIDHIEGQAVCIPGDDIDTDRIVPARYLKDITFDKMGEYLFYDIRHNPDHSLTDHPLNQSAYRSASVMVVGTNFGCGSSREHAPQAIKRAGFNAIIGKSFAEIFSGNCKALGVLTATVSKKDHDDIVACIDGCPDATVEIDIAASRVTVSDCSWSLVIKSTHQRAFLDGTWDELALLQQNSDSVLDVVKTLPYFFWAEGVNYD